MGRSVVVLGVVGLLLCGAVVGTTGAQSGRPNDCVGRITAPADGTTVISVQGQKFSEPDAGKTPARLVGVGPRGRIRWVHHSGRDLGVVWSYDVDPLPDGHLFVTATQRGRTLFYELDPPNGIVWRETLPIIDTHDADLLDEHRILIANMRNYNRSAGRNDDRLLIYNRTSDRVVWEWYFREHYPRSVGGNYSEDWTHVNDVDKVGPGEYLASPRNLDQVVLVNRSTGEVTWRLGRDDAFGTLRKQHNPDYLEGPDGRPTVLVADSENGRIVEYARTGDGWERTWELSGDLNWPRDADRLPDGNTLVTDSANHRVIEVTPDGEVVWEFYAPWLVYEAERITSGDGSNGPTIAEQGASGAYRLRNGQPRDPNDLRTCAETLRGFEGTAGTATGTSTSGADTTLTGTVGGPVRGQPGFGALAAALAVLAVLLALAVRGRYS